MIFAKIRNKEEKEQLDDALRSSQKKVWYRRLQIIALSAKRHTVEQLSKMFDLSKATIRSYIKSYNQRGLDGLMPRKPPGRPPKIAHWTKEQWSEVLEQTPDQYEKLDTHSHQWTLGLMTKYLWEYHQIEVSAVSVHNSLKKTGRRTGRSKLRVGSPDPDYVIKRDRLKEVQNLHYRDN